MFEKLEQLAKNNKKISALIAVDYSGYPCDWKNLRYLANKYNFKLVKSDPGIGPSDHTSFYLQNIPVLHLQPASHTFYIYQLIFDQSQGNI